MVFWVKKQTNNKNHNKKRKKKNRNTRKLKRFAFELLDKIVKGEGPELGKS